MPEDPPYTTLKTLGLLCPLPIIKTARAIKEVPLGAVIEVLSDDPGIVEDMPAWCEGTGHEFLGLRQEGRVYRVLVRKAHE